MNSLPHLGNSFKKTGHFLSLLPSLILSQRSIMPIQSLTSLLFRFISNYINHFLPPFCHILISLRDGMILKKIILWLLHLFLHLSDLLPIICQVEVDIKRVEKLFIPWIQILLKFSYRSLLRLYISTIGYSNTFCQLVKGKYIFRCI